jgi:hypothetical protein
VGGKAECEAEEEEELLGEHRLVEESFTTKLEKDRVCATQASNGFTAKDVEASAFAIVKAGDAANSLTRKEEIIYISLDEEEK